MEYIYWMFILLLGLVKRYSAIELTFELPSNAKECFYEEVRTNTSCLVEYQVVMDGKADVDVVVEDPMGQILYQKVKMKYDTHNFVSQKTGAYKVCFSNSFSSSHKLIYLDFQVGDEPPLPGLGQHATVLTQLEVSAQDIHKALKTIQDYQTHHRLRESEGRKRAEDLNERVLWWSILETVAVMTIAVGQVFVLKNFFTEKKPFNYAPLK